MVYKNKEIKFENKFGYLVCDGSYYELKGKDGKPTFVRVSKKIVDEKIKKVRQVAEKLKEGFDTVAVLTERLMQMDDKSIDTLFKLLFKSKIKYKPKTREGHCVDMKVGRFIIPIVD